MPNRSAPVGLAVALKGTSSPLFPLFLPQLPTVLIHLIIDEIDIRYRSLYGKAYELGHLLLY